MGLRVPFTPALLGLRFIILSATVVFLFFFFLKSNPIKLFKKIYIYQTSALEAKHYTMPNLEVLHTNILIVTGNLPLHVTQIRLDNKEGKMTTLIQFCACLHLKFEPHGHKVSVTHSDKGLQAVTSRYKGLQTVKSCYQQLQGVTTVTHSYKGLQAVTHSYKGLQAHAHSHTRSTTSQY